MNIDLAALLTVGGPTSVVGAVIAILLKSYLEARKDSREQQAADVQTDSGIVDNAKKVLELVRNETDRMEFKLLQMAEDNKDLSNKNRELEHQINQQDDIIARQGRQLDFLSDDLAKAREEIRQLRAGQRGEPQAD